MPDRSCPESILAAWRQCAAEVTGIRDEVHAIRALESAAGFLSDTFTTGRDPGFGDYAHNRRALAAYGLFFFPRSYVRTRLVLEEVAAHWSIQSPDIHLVDLGAGTGAAGFAALATFSQWQPSSRLHLTMVDDKPAGFEFARRVYAAGSAIWPQARRHEVQADMHSYQSPAGAHVILASFAINEWMDAEPPEKMRTWVRQQMNALKPGGWLVIMEPALHSSVERLERLRDVIAADKIARILAPCPHDQPCPMLAEKRGWCHEVRHWSPPSSLRMINRTLQRDVHLLKFSFLVLEKSPPAAADWMRLVSPVKKEKGKYVCHGCGADGKLHNVEWLTRHLNKEQVDASESLERGDRVAMPAGTSLGDGRTERVSAPPTLIAR